MSSAEIRPCVLVPTFNNARTLAAVLSRLLRHTSNLIVINDGCTDRTPEILAQFPSVRRINHSTNLGKGAALRHGLELAASLGYTHAISIDSDGQHDPDDIPRFVAAIREQPAALVIGIRNLRGLGRPLKSRLLRGHSNFWTWMATGRRPVDSQSGYRAYPLAAFRQIDCETAHYDFEVEALVKLFWLGVPLATVPVEVRYQAGHPSHFRLLLDSWLVIKLNGQLLLQRSCRPRSRPVLTAQTAA